MKNAPNLDLLLLARQWGATAVPFSDGSGSAWLDTPEAQRALTLLDQTANLLQPDRFEEDLRISRVRLCPPPWPRPSLPPPPPPALTPQQEEQARLRARECLRQLKAALR